MAALRMDAPCLGGWRTRAIAHRIPKIVFTGTAMATASKCQLERGDEERVGERVPHGREPVLERVVEDHRAREREDHARGSRARGTAGRSGISASYASCLRLRRSRTSAPARTTNAKTRRTTETAAAASGSSPSIALKMLTEATSVSNGMFPEMRTTEPNSPTAFPNESADPGEDRGHEVGEDDPAEGRERARPQGRGGLLHLAVELEEDGLDRPHDERERHEEQRQRDRGPRVGDVHADRALRPVDGEQRQPGDDRRQRERQVDDRVDGALAPEVVPDEHPRDECAGDRVDQDDEERDGERQLQGSHRRRRGHLLPERRQPAVERLDATTAAIGIRTMRLRYAVESPRTRPPARLEPPARAGRPIVSGLVVSRNP